MNFFELIESRHSCRAFQEAVVEKEKLQLILDAIDQAPSAGNLQAYAVKVVTNNDTKEKLTSLAFGQDFIRQAPLVLVFFSVPDLSAKKYGDRGRFLYCIQDATIACTYAQLAATDLGLASCWVGAFDVWAVERCLKADWPWRAIAMLPIGYAETPLTSPPKVSRVELSTTHDPEGSGLVRL